MIRVEVHIHTTDQHVLASIVTLVKTLASQGEVMMETVQSLNDKLDNLTNVVGQERTEVQGMMTDLKNQIQVLTDRLNTGIAVTQADLDGMGARIDTATTNIQAISDAPAV